MFVERKINNTTGCVELWKCEWVNHAGQPAHKEFISKVGDEQPLQTPNKTDLSEQPAICWSYGRTLGNIAVFSQSLLGRFPGQHGSDATLPCDFVNAGKFRHGADRWWCRTHQSHWGTKADIAAVTPGSEMRCANSAQKMNYVVGPLTLDLNQSCEVGVWCSMPAALSSGNVKPRAPKIHVHVRPTEGAPKTIDSDFEAISLQYNASQNLFGNSEITIVNITPPAAFEFVKSLENKTDLDCINCSHCGYPHLDMADFAKRPHRKHFCANCGRDSTWSKGPIISTPLKPLHDAHPQASKFVEPDRKLNLDEYKNCKYAIWASTPAVIWTAKRPQEKGIHVHVHNGTARVVDDTYSEVVLNGETLDRSKLINMMFENTQI